jgi:heme-degrading monooxygenase HmoA
MAVCLVHDAPGVTRAQYEQVFNEVTADGPPQGVRSHVAGATENGWCVVEVWESREALDRFFQERLQQALQRAGIGGQPRIFEVVNTMQP